VTVAGAIGAVAGLGTELLQKVPDADPQLAAVRVRARVARLTMRERLRLLDDVRVAREQLVVARARVARVRDPARRARLSVEVERRQVRLDVLAAQLEAVDAHEVATIAQPTA
jgi:hypothetical protein